MKYIDIHCHPALKTFLGSDVESDRESCWEEIDLEGLWEIVDLLTGKIIDSQASLTQLEKGKCQIAVAALYSLEHPLITGKIAGLTSLLDISKHLEELSHELMEKISNNENGYSYFEVLNALKVHIENSKGVSPGFNFLNRISELDENRLNIILAIEGGHALLTNHSVHSEEEILQNLTSLKNSSLRYLYLTLTHLANFPFANQCYGMKLIEHEDFKPTGFGITPLGEKVIKRALETNDGNRILIDIKHMSLKSRFQYYEGIRNGNFPDVPIIISHAGVTGVSYKKMPVYEIHADEEHVAVDYVKPKGLIRTEFNPWSINLYDEEIPIIIESDGLIGLIMEERILGCGKVDTEYFSRSEFEEFQNDITPNINHYRTIHFQEGESESEQVKLSLLGRQLRHLCNNILHIVKIGGEDAWKHMCFGSDFDGMVDAVSFCKDASGFKRLHRKLCRALPIMAESDPQTNYYISNIEQQVDDLLYHNAKNFLNKYFD